MGGGGQGDVTLVDHGHYQLTKNVCFLLLRKIRITRGWLVPVLVYLLP